MSEFDVRKKEQSVITSIVFSQPQAAFNGANVAYKLTQWDHADGVIIQDIEYDVHEGTGYVLLTDKQQALNLIKALEKAIEVRWLM